MPRKTTIPGVTGVSMVTGTATPGFRPTGTLQVLPPTTGPTVTAATGTYRGTPATSGPHRMVGARITWSANPSILELDLNAPATAGRGYGFRMAVEPTGPAFLYGNYSEPVTFFWPAPGTKQTESDPVPPPPLPSLLLRNVTESPTAPLRLQAFRASFAVTRGGNELSRYVSLTARTPGTLKVGALSQCTASGPQIVLEVSAGDQNITTAENPLLSSFIFGNILGVTTRAQPNREEYVYGFFRHFAVPTGGNAQNIINNQYVPATPTGAIVRVEAYPRWTTQRVPRLHNPDYAASTGTATLERITGPTGTGPPSVPVALPPWTHNETGELTLRLPPGPLPDGAYVLRIDPLTIPYPARPTGIDFTLPETPPADRPTAAKLSYPFETSFVVDTIPPAGSVSSPPPFSAHRVTRLEACLSELTTLPQFGSGYRPYELRRDGQLVPGTYSINGRPGPSALATAVVLQYPDAVGSYELRQSPTATIFRDQAGNPATTPWPTIRWTQLATGATAPPHGRFAQFAEPLHEPPASIRLTFSEPVTGARAAALTLFVDNATGPTGITLTGAGREYTVAGFAPHWNAGTAFLLTFDAAAVTTEQGAAVTGAIQTAFLRNRQPPLPPLVATYQQIDTYIPPLNPGIGATHFSLAAHTTTLPTGPAIAVTLAATGAASHTVTSLTAFAVAEPGPTLEPYPATTAPAYSYLSSGFITRGILYPTPARRTGGTNIERPSTLRQHLATPANRHAIFTDGEEVSAIDLEVEADSVTDRADYEPGTEIRTTPQLGVGRSELAHVWPLIAARGTYRLLSTHNGDPLTPGSYQATKLSGFSATTYSGTPGTITGPAYPTPTLYAVYSSGAFFYPGSGLVGDPEGLAQAAIDAGGQPVYGPYRSHPTSHTLDLEYTVTPLHVQAWLSATRELLFGPTRCNTIHLTPGLVAVYIQLRVACQIDLAARMSPGRPVARYVRLFDGWHEYTLQNSDPSDPANQLTRRWYRVRHFAYKMLLPRSALTEFVAGQPITRRFPANFQIPYDGWRQGVVEPTFPFDPYPNPNAPTVTAFPSQFATFTLRKAGA